MTDGTTGFHVAPITEDDMNRVTSILKRAMDTMIGASQLAADVDMLRQTVSGLQADADRLRNQNNALDEALNHSRQVRDEQFTKIADLTGQLGVAHDERDSYRVSNDKLHLANEQLVIDLDLTRKAKDDAEFRVMELEDELTKAKAKLDKLADTYRALFPPEAVKPEPAPPQPSEHEPAGEVFAKTEPALAKPDSLTDWEPGYIWDPATGRYWREGVTPKADGANLPF